MYSKWFYYILMFFTLSFILRLIGPLLIPALIIYLVYTFFKNREIHSPVLVNFSQRGDCFLSAAAFLSHYDMAFLVTPENGLDAQHGADHCAGGAEPSGAPQEHQVIHSEELA